MRHPEVIDFLRAEGITVVETNGWQTRGSATFDPAGSVNHHTAGAAYGMAPSLGIVLNGRGTAGHADYLPPPLCNVLQGRDDKAYLVAAGRANHAGEGGWRGLVGNSRVWGLEVEHVGTTSELFPDARREVSVRIHAAFAKCSGYDASMVCQHYEWAGPRKSDFLRALLEPDPFRHDVATLLAPGDEDFMTEAEKQEFAAAIIAGTTKAVLAALADDAHQVVADRIKKAAHYSKALADAHVPPLA